MLRPSPSHILSPDTQAVLLLCGRFGRAEDAAAKPLTQAEYDRLAEWLLQHQLRPADLLDPGTGPLLHDPGRGVPIPAARLQALLGRGAALAFAVESWSNKGLWVISRSDAAYPQRLKGRRRGPPILYGVGEAALPANGGLAIIGSRDVTAEALQFTREVAEACAAQGIPVVSGGARGVDSQAMDAALGAGGQVVGVLADSLTKTAVAGKYRQALIDGSLVLLSPYDPGAGFDVGNAMQRNKHIYGLADWALVVASTVEKGGTWAGAVEALKAEKTPVFVRAHGPASVGNRKLLDLGARPFPLPPWTDLRTQLAHALTHEPAITRLQASLPLPAAVPADRSAQTNISPGASMGSLAPGAGDHPAPASNAVPSSRIESQATTAFDYILPLLLDYLTEPRDAREIAALLDVHLSQAQDWLKRAVAQEKVMKVGRSSRYVAVAPQLQLDPNC